jgi:type IV secretory pathway VirJ component
VAVVLASAARLSAQDSAAITASALREFPATTAGAALALLLTGDGGFAAFDRALGEGLAARGIAVIGVDSRTYFSKARTPEETARDMGALAETYLARWKRSDLVLVGYSRGANVAPFIATRLVPSLRERLTAIAMIGLLPNANFHYHTIDLIENKHRDDDRPTVPEVERLRGLRMLCLYGAEEKESGCRSLDPGLVKVVERQGGHRVHSDYESIVEEVAKLIARSP